MTAAFSRANLLVALALFCLNVALNLPLFREGAMPYRDSIELGYAAMARYFYLHPNPFGWNAMQYCGLPTQFTYLPGIQYLAAMLAHLLPLEPIYVYRLLASGFACLGPSTLFLCIVYFTRQRWWALAVALAYTFFSPLYGIVAAIDRDRGNVQLPWRLLVLVKYGEGPHNAGLTLLPLAVISLWETCTNPKYSRLFLAAILCALIALTNWIAALALAGCAALLALTALGTPGVNFRFPHLVICGFLAYGLAAFWLTPTFISTIAFNWPADAFNYHLQEQQQLLLGGLVVGLVVLRALFKWLFPAEYFTCFVALGTFAFGWVSLWFYSRGINTLPESRRYAVEFELFFLVLLGEYFRLALRRPRPVAIFCTVIPFFFLLDAGRAQALRYTTQGFASRNPVPFAQTIEYRLAAKLASLKPKGRVYVSGGLRFRLNAWFEIPQVGGGFESGLRNRTPVVLAYQIRTGQNSAPGQETADAILALRAMGVEYVVVHGRQSREHYRDFQDPGKFEGALELVHREEDDSIYRVPYQSLAHLVRWEERLEWPTTSKLPVLGPYVAAVERRPLATEWRGPTELHVRGTIVPDTFVALPVSHDTGWRAWQGGQPIEVLRDSLGFLMLRARPETNAAIVLRYGGSFEPYAMAVLSALVWSGACLFGWRKRLN
ncbi:MAG: hypothetical protein K2X03_11740 [Bryobacteraceae bacterium]|nr:hypothetical protein [Bryobacteraceae bacterium]